MGMMLNKKSAIFYLYQTTFKNRVKKALKKPITYLYIAFIVFYLILVFVSFNSIFKEIPVVSDSLLAAFFTVLGFVFIPSNLISYAKRKGLVFRSSDIHFMFPSPIGPKRVLFYAHVRMILMGLIMNIIVSVGGVIWFDMPLWKMFVYFLFSCVAENILEASMMILCYGNERLNRKQMFLFTLFLYGLIAVFVIIGIFVYINEGGGFRAVLDYLHSPYIQMVPVIGWYIAFIHLLFMGATAVNVIGSVLFFLSVIVLFIMARRMKCTGEYYEDAIKFAEDYEIAKEKGKKGEIAFVGWKKKYGKASVSYKGSYAKAIFYRQLLEYKKNRFFIFGFYTLVCLGLGIGMAVFAVLEGFDGYEPYVVLGIMAYLTFIFSSYAGKWSKELTKPYTYLIPDSSFHKLWYATVIEHIRSLIDGCLLTIPVGIVTGMSVIQMILIIAVYICMQACKLYSEVMVEAFLGNILGSVGKQFARLFFEGTVIGLGIICAAVGTLLVSVEIGFLVLILVAAFLTSLMMIVATLNFQRMETVD